MTNQDLINENLIEVLGIGSLPDERKIAMLKKMGELVQKRIALNILKKLGLEEKEKFVEATDNNDDGVVQTILDKHNIDMAGLIEEETNNLKQELKANTASLGV
ncbi:MAG: hypothetical protein A2725_01325 [Candidatus Magasanikbacteria bacterium RIFCSPHIGHO2_01_FULL_33_34]|uniref:Uncharacterized protein n=1 Tax=Candidatus Magasanikbacteria bacterium RIFCSPHIGHO2_01_FULL_33_34 TaxID=1798671 RepID=A0A1F6LJ83_9BACT|nr:MAG: hypothetical protein A2725_01325 [Candidatus Magasanikbacteria bacterium RIFCSPHIGHO2_01_FULL_33_34]OGH65460.1 MAG: hypothetical protein A3B83_01080 [Candidatus Magasanikbacteria bacterium RIFCSPHIGHO2_02_FULL_33_17]OGH76170.1 MAG: hypothetical protein A3A89_01900 [Candidatus Magasanikbacteria bacterium RIFCSPLOWO2_01_FULL_33_34]OGH81016.1 MAG: hypothetical protein A3F93_04525 [Candidatus Magasanikbacteria bacterium RIFCSPLOWO2_12_FULL_34_7]